MRRFFARVLEVLGGHAGCNDTVAYISGENDRLHNENAALVAENCDLVATGDQMQDRVDKLEAENADLNGRVQDLSDQLTSA